MRLPLPIPAGWFQVGWIDDLPAGAVKPVRYFGADLALWRDAAGDPHLFDAACPHLGAHLGYGAVDGGLVCPFHGWRFDARGACAGIPYSGRVPRGARVRSWPVVARSGGIWAWHHPTGESPAWEVPRVPEHANPAWAFRRRYTWRIATCPQEIAENSVDRAHFQTVHGTVDLPETTLTLAGPRREAVSEVRLKTPRGVVEGRIAVNAWGLGHSVTRFTGICDTALIISHAPVDSQRVHSRFTFLQWGEGSRVGAALIRDIVKQMEEDIPIWENKRYLARPALCDGDGPIGRFRAWSRQFYATLPGATRDAP